MKIDNRQQFLVILVAAAAALLLGNSLVYEPLAKWWTSRSEEIVRLRKQVADGNRLIKYKDSYRSQWAQMQTNTLPNDPSLAEQKLTGAFDTWSSVTGANVTGIMPQWKNDSDDYMTLNCRVEASGNLSTLCQFLYNIEKDPMALRLESVELSARDNTGQMLTLGLQISGLVLNQPTKK